MHTHARAHAYMRGDVVVGMGWAQLTDAGYVN